MSTEKANIIATVLSYKGEETSISKAFKKAILKIDKD